MTTPRNVAVIEATNKAQSVGRQCFIKSVSSIIRREIAAELFDLFNQIAVLRYEEAANSGLLLLCRPDSTRTMLSLSLEAPFDVRSLRGVRKMLQISDQQLCLLCDGRAVHGFTTVGAKHPNTLIIQFHPHGIWELQQDGCVIVQFHALGEALVSSSLSEDRFITDARNVFGELSGAELQRLWSLISIAQGQLRGTNVLISVQAAAEATRLRGQCTRVKPTLLTPMLMERLTSIDGTVIIDTHGVCHAIGAILDGQATERGDRTRGGRYNSAVMYVDSSPFPSLVVVISQDGMVDLVCGSQKISGK